MPSADVVINLLRETCERLRTVDEQLTSSLRIRLLTLLFFAFQFFITSFQAVSSALATSKNNLVFIASTFSFSLLIIVLIAFLKTRDIRSVEQEAQGALLSRLRRLVNVGSQMHEMGDLTASERLRLDIALADAEILLKMYPAAQDGARSNEDLSRESKPRTRTASPQTSPEPRRA